MNAGHLVAGRYKLIELVGQGAMGSVWRAAHVGLGTEVAVKFIDPEIARDPDAAARFEREAKAAALLRSTHVVQVLDHGVEDGVPYIAMELLQGESLGTRLERVGRLSPAAASRVITHVARAVFKAHQAGIVHRDLKPDNIYLVPGEDEELAKVLDFGIAKSSHASLGLATAKTRTGMMIGTPWYMSPEQARATSDLDFHTDLWSLGVIAYECVVGSRPFQSDSLADLLVKIVHLPLPVPSESGAVPPGFDEWFARACNRDPLQRFSDAKELAQSLARLAEPFSSEEASLRISTSGVREELGVASSASGVQSFHGATASGLVRSGGELPDKARSSKRSMILVAATIAFVVLAAIAVLSLQRRNQANAVETGGPAALVAGADLTPAASQSSGTLATVTLAAESVAPASSQPPSDPAAIGADAGPRDRRTPAVTQTKTGSAGQPTATRSAPAAPTAAKPPTREYGF